MSDDDLIRRGDALKVALQYARLYVLTEAAEAIAALPAAPAEGVRAGALKEAAAIIGKHKHHWEDAQRHVLALIPEAKP